MSNDIIPRDRHIRRDGDSYGVEFLTYLPGGQAWPREPGSTLVNVCTGLAYTYGFVDSRAADLLERESDPRKTIELLPDWERAWGLPDPCFPDATTIGERQRMLVLIMTMLGSQSRAWFEWVADWIGFQINFREWSPFMAGISRVGDTRPVKLDEGISKSSVEIANLVPATFVMERTKQILGYERPAYNFKTGTRVRAIVGNDTSQSVEGLVTSYVDSSRTLKVSIDRVNGVGIFNNWIVTNITPHNPVVDNTQSFRWEIGPPEMRFYWSVEAAIAGVVWFRAASGQAGVDPHVRIMTAPELACLFRRWKPAQTELVFDYSSLAAGGPMQGTP